MGMSIQSYSESFPCIKNRVVLWTPTRTQSLCQHSLSGILSVDADIFIGEVAAPDGGLSLARVESHTNDDL